MVSLTAFRVAGICRGRWSQVQLTRAEVSMGLALRSVYACWRPFCLAAPFLQGKLQRYTVKRENLPYHVLRSVLPWEDHKHLSSSYPELASTLQKRQEPDSLLLQSFCLCVDGVLLSYLPCGDFCQGNMGALYADSIHGRSKIGQKPNCRKDPCHRCWLPAFQGCLDFTIPSLV